MKKEKRKSTLLVVRTCRFTPSQIIYLDNLVGSGAFPDVAEAVRGCVAEYRLNHPVIVNGDVTLDAVFSVDRHSDDPN